MPDTPTPGSPTDGFSGRAARGRSIAVIGIFVILLLAAVQEARNFLLPVIFAFLLFFVLMPVHRRLTRLGLNGTLVAGTLVVGLLVALGGIMLMLGGPFSKVTDNLPEIISEITARLEAARAALMTVAQNLRPGDPSDIPSLRPPLPEEADDASAERPEIAFLRAQAGGALLYLAEAPAMVAQLVFALILLFFMLSSSHVLYCKIIQCFSSFPAKRAALNTLRETESKLGGYLGAITLINAGLGVCVGLAMWALGMPVPVFFGVLAFLLNFIPYLGAVMGMVLSTIVALLWFDTLGQVFLTAIVYLLLTAIEGQLVTPTLLARRLRMNAVPVFLSVAFWAWMWGFMGMLIAVPILVALLVLTEQIRGLRGIAHFLSAK